MVDFRCRVVVKRDISYADGLELQKKYLNLLKKDKLAEEVLIFCEHKPVLTLGRSGDGSSLLSSREEVERDGIEFFEAARGGDITYHGTGQWTIYPLLRLENFSKDLHHYMRLLEETVIGLLAGYGVDAGSREGLTGVWVGKNKICAIGVAVSRWISWHGFAFNVQPDLQAFSRHIVPCGISASEGGVTSLAEVTDREYAMESLIEPICNAFSEVFPYKIIN